MPLESLVDYPEVGASPGEMLAQWLIVCENPPKGVSRVPSKEVFGCFPKLWVLFVGVLTMRALLLGVGLEYILILTIGTTKRGPKFLETSTFSGFRAEEPKTASSRD